MGTWVAGQQAMLPHLRKEITPWEPLPQPADNQSTYSSHYQQWQLPPRRKATKPKDERPASAAHFDTRSTMQDSYQHWSGRHFANSCRPQSAYVPTDWMQPISTTHREAFQQWTAPKRQTFKPKLARDVPAGGPTGRSTMQDSYQPIGLFVPTMSAQPVEKPLDITPFDGTTTSRSSYQAWPLPPKHGRKKPSQTQEWMGGNNNPMPNSTYRDMFREITIAPSSQKAVGIQVVGGKFYPMMPKGTRPPAVKKVMMTTTMDKQMTMDLVVVQTADAKQREGAVLGEFTLDGIAPSRAGIPQVEVTFVYSNDNSLRVTANDLQGQRTRALSVKNKVYLG